MVPRRPHDKTFHYLQRCWGGGGNYMAVTGQLKTTPELLITNSRETERRGKKGRCAAVSDRRVFALVVCGRIHIDRSLYYTHNFGTQHEHT